MTFLWDPDDVDETTSLPRVPEGYFWRVGFGGIYDDPIITLYRKSRLWKSVINWRRLDSVESLMRETPEDYPNPITEEDVVYQAAWFIVAQQRERQKERQKYARYSALTGDYPPRQLKL